MATNSPAPFATPPAPLSVSSSTGNQFIRKADLILANDNTGTTFGDLRMTFKVTASDWDTPNILYARLYNLSRQTINRIISEYDRVILSAGYANGYFGQIFGGQVKQYKQGREDNVDNFLDVYAADGDEAYNFGIVNTAVGAGSTYTDRFNAICQSLGLPQDPNAKGYLSATGGILPRGKVLFGMARSYLDEIASGTLTRWSIQNGVVTLIPLDGYLPGQAVQINSATGMIGVPESTDSGILVRTLLNPIIKIGGAVQLNNQDITQTIIKDQFFPNYDSITYTASFNPNGLYRVMVVEHEGDTRSEGASWVTEITCLNIDPTTGKVLPFGGPFGGAQ